MQLPPLPDCPLTDRQLAILRIIATDGERSPEIAVRLGITRSTVKSHLHEAYKRLRVKSGAAAVAVCVTAGWLDVIDTAWEDSRVTAAQSLYLKAFVRFLYERSPAALQQRRFWLRGVFYEARVDAPVWLHDGVCDLRSTEPWELLGVPRFRLAA